MWILSDNKEKEVKDMCHSYLRIKEIVHSQGITKNAKMDMIFAEIVRR